MFDWHLLNRAHQSLCKIVPASARKGELVRGASDVSSNPRSACLTGRLRQTVLALGLGIATTASFAQTQVVIDPTSIGQNAAHFAQEIAQMKLQLDNQLQQLKQLIANVTGFRMNLDLGGQNLQRLSDAQRDDLIQMNCQSSSGGIIGNALSSLASMGSQPIRKSQQQICAQIVMTQVDKYNLTVDMLNKVQSYHTAFDQVSSIIDEVSNLADSGRATTQTQTYTNALTTEMANWRAKIEADDAIIRTLQDQQSMLARTAVNGGGGGGSAIGAILGGAQ